MTGHDGPGSLRLSRVHFPVTALGPGTRLGVWVQGCHLACPGCMARDTWDPADGHQEALDDLVDVWREVRRHGATGLTVSGGEPAEQADAVAELVRRIRRADDGLTRAGPAGSGGSGFGLLPPFDVLVFTGLDEEEFQARCQSLACCVDAVMLGRFDVTRPTDLIWRGSGNQRLVTFTALGAQRYAPYLEAVTTAPPMQFVVDAQRIWTIGVPRIGDLPRLERRLNHHGLDKGRVSWRP